MRQSLLDAEVDANELLEGKARAFVHVHTSGMLDLVTSSHTVKSEVTPETLLFDVHRLAFLQREFQFLVAASTMLVSAANYLKDDAVVARIGEEILAPLHEMDYERVMEEISAVLVDLPVERKQSVMHILTQCTSPADIVHKVITIRMRTLVGGIMSSGQARVLHETRFIQPAKPLFARIQKLSTKLMSLANLNRTVRLPTYNMLIGKAALGHCRRPELAAGDAKRVK